MRISFVFHTLKITSQLNNIPVIGAGVDKSSKIIDTNWESFFDNILVTTIDDTLEFNQLYIINGEKKILAKYSNLFPNKTALLKAQRNKTDANSLFCNPLFLNPKSGDFTVKDDSPALKIGFKNFPMDKFGVQKLELKAIAKQPEIPTLKIELSEKKEVKTKLWLGATL